MRYQLPNILKHLFIICVLIGKVSGTFHIVFQVRKRLLDTGKFVDLALKQDEDEHSIEMQFPYIAKIMEKYVKMTVFCKYECISMAYLFVKLFFNLSKMTKLFRNRLYILVTLITILLYQFWWAVYLFQRSRKLVRF